MAMKWLRKKSVAKRYDRTERWVDQAVHDGRLPPPKYRDRTPFWNEGELDRHDRRTMIAARPDKTAEQASAARARAAAAKRQPSGVETTA